MHLLGFFILIVIGVLLYAFSGSASLANSTSVLFTSSTFKAFALVAMVLAVFVLVAGTLRSKH